MSPNRNFFRILFNQYYYDYCNAGSASVCSATGRDFILRPSDGEIKQLRMKQIKMIICKSQLDPIEYLLPVSFHFVILIFVSWS